MNHPCLQITRSYIQKTLKTLIENTLGPVKEFSETTGNKINNIQKSVALLGLSEKEIMKTIPFTIVPKKKNTQNTLSR